MKAVSRLVAAPIYAPTPAGTRLVPPVVDGALVVGGLLGLSRTDGPRFIGVTPLSTRPWLVGGPAGRLTGD